MITCKIKGKEYLLVDMSYDKYNKKRRELELSNIDVLFKGFRYERTSIFSFMFVVEVLVPTDKLDDFYRIYE